MTWELIFPLVLVIAALSSPVGKMFKQPGDEAERKGPTETGISAPSEPMKRPLGTRPFEGSATTEPSGTSPFDAGGSYSVKRHPHPVAVNAQEARRGIILMSILGPCRAFDPPNPQY